MEFISFVNATDSLLFYENTYQYAVFKKEFYGSATPKLRLSVDKKR